MIQFPDHVEQYHPLISYQLAYRPYYSTETALLKVQWDLSLNTDKHMTTVLVLLDLGAAFATFVFSILMQILQLDVGVMGL